MIGCWLGLQRSPSAVDSRQIRGRRAEARESEDLILRAEILSAALRALGEHG